MKLSIRSSGSRLYLADEDAGGRAIPYPIVGNACLSAWWQVPNLYGLAGRSAWDQYYVEPARRRYRAPMALWAEEQGREMLRAGISVTGMWVDLRISTEVPGLWGWHVLANMHDHAAALVAGGLQIEEGRRILIHAADRLLEDLGRHGRSSRDVVAICDWNEPAWNLLLAGAQGDTILTFLAELYPWAMELMNEQFPRALITGPRVAGSTRKDRPDSGWVGRYRVDLQGQLVEREPDDPSSHYWRHVRMASADRAVYAQNCYSDDPERWIHRLDLVSAALRGWGHTGAVAVAECTWAMTRGLPHAALWAQRHLPRHPAWTYPVGGSPKDGAGLYVRSFAADVERGCCVASSIYGWTTHNQDWYPLGMPWGPVIPTWPGADAREYRDQTWIQTLGEGIARVRERHTQLVENAP